ncbi:hypothetical protein VPNG_10201 [Cytospora leucostoma]|uniref:Dystroglycan-type cadherin-like domain-containing protein n=1 Tax=Cytospora leucostoma TaxID=1230097 RepID=A0A423VD86_9PEZI|nr:hypothetical protein VPNG_10201 [Cytospora leucostoma]
MLSIARTLIILTLTRAVVIEAAPTVSFPINSQVPPVARIAKPFSFTFSASTFTSSSSSALSYQLQDPPSWLSLDSDHRTLYGTPQDDDVATGEVVGVSVILVATDSTGSISHNATLVVSRDTGPTVEVAVSEQIQSFGTYSEPASILQYPDTPFKFTFAQDTFSDPKTPELNYYAVTIDNSPLPAWVSFDPGTLSFAGITPPFDSLVEPPQTFTLKLVASDVTGFSAVAVNFSIVVGNHALTADHTTIQLNATAGKPIKYGGLAGTVKIDGRPVGGKTLEKVLTDNLPSWLTFDQNSWDISGTPPETAQSTSFSVVMEDTYSDRLNIKFDVQVANRDSVFQTAFPTLDLKPGSKLSFDLRPYLLDPSDVEVIASIRPSTSWLHFDASSFTLSGDVPKSATKSVIEVMFSANTKHTRLKRDGAAAQTQKLTIQVLSATDSTTSSTPSSTPSTNSTSNHEASPKGNSAKQKSSPVLVAVLVSAIIAVLILICLLFCFYRRRQKRLSRTPLEGNESAGPKPGSFTQLPRLGGPSSSALDMTQQHDVARTKSAAEKSKPRKPSNLRLEYTGSPDVMTPPLPVIVYDVGSQSNFSTSKIWLAPLRNFRIPHLKRSVTRDLDNLSDDDDRRCLGLDFPPPITLSRGSQKSFRGEFEGSIPAVEREDSIQQTPEVAYGQTPGIQGPPPRNPARVQTPDGVDRIDHEISPVDNSEIVNEKHRQPAGAPNYHQHPALRHEESQKSFASFSSIDTFKDQTRKLAAKATASAKGAASLANSAIVQVPKRKTLRALGKARLHFNESPTAGRGIFENVTPAKDKAEKLDYISKYGSALISPRSWPHHDPGAPATVPAPKRPAETVPLDSDNHRRRRSRMSGSSSSQGSSSHLSLGNNHNNNRAGNRVVSPSTPGGAAATGSGSNELPSYPTPLRVRNPDASGLGISGYEDIANSSPFRPTLRSASNNSWSTVQSGLSNALERPVTARTTQSGGGGGGGGAGRSFRNGGWNEPNVVIHEESPTFEEAVSWLGTTVGDQVDATRPGDRWRGAEARQGSSNHRRRSRSGGSGGSDGHPVFL